MPTLPQGANVFSPLLGRKNATEKDAGSYAALLGEAHQYLVTGLLMRLGFLVSVITVRGGTFDLIIPAFEHFAVDNERNVLLRTQVRTMRDSLKFTAGTRSGADRIYIPGVKVYKYTLKHNDLIIGVDQETLDLYFVPTSFIEKWGKSVSKLKLLPLKNNIDVLLNWNDAFLSHLKARL